MADQSIHTICHYQILLVGIVTIVMTAVHYLVGSVTFMAI